MYVLRALLKVRDQGYFGDGPNRTNKLSVKKVLEACRKLQFKGIREKRY